MLKDYYSFDLLRRHTLTDYQTPEGKLEAVEALTKAYRKDVLPWVAVYIDEKKEEEKRKQVDLTDPEQVESYYYAMVASTKRKPKES